MKKLFDDYAVLEQLAAGGWADVYRVAKYEPDGTLSLFSLKVLSPQFGEDGDIRQMFEDEAHLQMLLHHENLLRCHRLVREGNSMGMVLDYVDGLDLRSFLRACRRANISLSLDLIVYILLCVISALGYVHEKCDEDGLHLDIVHLDINPRNILLGCNGKVRVIDFGIAQHRLRHQLAGMLKTCGKFAYIAPEQLSGERVDRRADIFSTGAVVYEMVSGKRLFSGENQSAIFDSVMYRDIPGALDDLGMDVMLHKILEKMLHRDTASRYQTCGQVRKDLFDFTKKRGRVPQPLILEKAMNEVLPHYMLGEQEVKI